MDIQFQPCIVRFLCYSVPDLYYIFHLLLSHRHLSSISLQFLSLSLPFLPSAPTVLRDNRRHAGAAADHHREAESPAAAPVLHGRPQEQVGGQLSHARQEEVEVGVAAQRRGVVGQADVDGRVREPAVEEQGQRDKAVR